MKCTSALLSSKRETSATYELPDPQSLQCNFALYVNCTHCEMSRLDGVRHHPSTRGGEGSPGVLPPSLLPPGYIICQLRGPPPSHSISPNPKRLGGDSKGGGRGEKHHLAPTAHLVRTLSKPFTVISHFHFSPFVRYNLKQRRRHSLLTVHSFE